MPVLKYRRHFLNKTSFLTPKASFDFVLYDPILFLEARGASMKALHSHQMAAWDNCSLGGSMGLLLTRWQHRVTAGKRVQRKLYLSQPYSKGSDKFICISSLGLNFSSYVTEAEEDNWHLQ